MISSQKKVTEQKIKIVMDDGGETRALIDTLLSENCLKDSLTLKDGKIIIIKTH